MSIVNMIMQMVELHVAVVHAIPKPTTNNSKTKATNHVAPPQKSIVSALMVRSFQLVLKRLSFALRCALPSAPRPAL